MDAKFSFATFAVAAGAVLYTFLSRSKSAKAQKATATAANLPEGAWTKPPVRAGDMQGPIVVTELWIHPIKVRTPKPGLSRR
jgi:hypothetical protein